jgi:hypothetical protein
VKLLRRLVLGGICALALGGSLTATSASAALPEFVGPIPQPFSSALKASTLETASKLVVRCAAGTDSGELTGTKTLTITLHLTGCMVNGISCNSASAAPGEIVTSVLSGALGYIHVVKKVVGLDLSSPAGGPFTTFNCSAELRFAVFGSVIGKITPINTLLAPPAHFTLKFAQKESKQKPKKFEGGPVDVLETSLNAGPLEVTGLAVTDEIEFAAPLEIKA